MKKSYLNDSAEKMGPSIKGLVILVAEDHKINQTIIRKLLTFAGHSVCIVNNGQEACDRVASERFDLVIMDVHMPILNGLGATDKIRRSGNSIPIIGCTADSSPEQIASFIEYGMTDVVTKPIHSSELLDSINKALG